MIQLIQDYWKSIETLQVEGKIDEDYERKIFVFDEITKGAFENLYNDATLIELMNLFYYKRLAKTLLTNLKEM